MSIKLSEVVVDRDVRLDQSILTLRFQVPRVPDGLAELVARGGIENVDAEELLRMLLGEVMKSKAVARIPLDTRVRNKHFTVFTGIVVSEEFHGSYYYRVDWDPSPVPGADMDHTRAWGVEDLIVLGDEPPRQHKRAIRLE